MKTSQKLSFRSLPILGISLLAICALVIVPGTIKAQWNPNTSVNLQISGLPTADMETVPTSDGKTWIAFYHENSGNYDMRAQLIDANGFKLLGPDGILVSNLTSGSATFVFNVCVDSSNNLIIGFQAEITGGLKAVLFKISQTGSQLWGSGGIILGGGLVPNPAVLDNQEVAVTWDADAGNTLNLQKITTSGTPAWSPPKQIKVGATATTRGQIVANTADKFTVVYQKRGSGVSTTLYAQMFDNAGTALYSPLQLTNQTTSAARYYSVCGEADTTYCGYYASQGMRFNSFMQRINPDGTLPYGINGSNFNTNTGTNDNYQTETSINLTPGSAFAWAVCTFCDPNQTVYGVYVQKFLKSDGARQLTNTGKVVYPISTSMDTQRGYLALVDDGPMFLSYISTYKIYATRLDASGNFVWPGNRVEISSTTATPSNGKMRFGFTPIGPNRCAGIWTEKRTANYMGYAQGISVGGLVGLIVATQGGVPAAISTNGGTLQLIATVYPASANQSVNWSIVPGSGTASINPTGLVTAITNGNVFAVAKAVQDTTVSDTLMILISGQTTGIAGKNSLTINVSPVPNDGHFNIAISGQKETPYSLEIVNNLGIRVYNRPSVSVTGNTVITVDLADVPAGIYTVILRNAEEKLTRKILLKQ